MYTDPKDKLFCEIGQDLGYLNQSQIEQALDSQRVDRAMAINKPVGSYFFEAKILTKEQISQIVKMQDKIGAPEQAVRPVPPGNSHPSGIHSGNVQQLPQGSADIGAVIIWFFICFPLGYTQWNQSAKGWVWLLIFALTQGVGGIVIIIDYWMCYGAQRNRTLGPWEFFPH